MKGSDDTTPNTQRRLESIKNHLNNQSAPTSSEIYEKSEWKVNLFDSYSCLDSLREDSNIVLTGHLGYRQR